MKPYVIGWPKTLSPRFSPCNGIELRLRDLARRDVSLTQKDLDAVEASVYGPTRAALLAQGQTMPSVLASRCRLMEAAATYASRLAADGEPPAAALKSNTQIVLTTAEADAIKERYAKALAEYEHALRARGGKAFFSGPSPRIPEASSSSPVRVHSGTKERRQAAKPALDKPGDKRPKSGRQKEGIASSKKAPKGKR